MFSGLPGPHPDPLVTSTDPDPTSDPSIIKQKTARKTLIDTVLSLLDDFLSLKNDVNVPVFRIRKFLGLPDPHPESGSVNQRYGSEDPHLHPDLYQNVTVP
jgi:hypothetical protein